MTIAAVKAILAAAGGTVPSAFDPATISGNKLFVATNESALTVDGGGSPVHGALISQIDDLTSNGRDMAQATQADMPSIDANTLPGIKLLRCNDARRLTGTGLSAAAAEIVVVAWTDVGADSPERLIGQDTYGVMTQ